MSPRRVRNWFLRRPRVRGGSAVAAAIAFGLLVGAFGAIPVFSQTVTLTALRAAVAVNEADPWATVWDNAPFQAVPLSAQNIAPPFGGGTVATLTARALHDGERLFLNLEWSDGEANTAVNGYEQFADAAAVQFPAGSASSLPPFTMGGRDAQVNIWQWKALWQADIADGFATTLTRYPNTLVDDYPGSGTLYRPAEHVGNPLAAREHASPVENLIAQGFGTLTTADVQDVAGAGVWRDGKWRALFARDFAAADDGLVSFAEGSATRIAFAIWDGEDGDRNGQKSIAPWIELAIGEGEAGAAADGNNGTLLIIIFALIASLALAVYFYTVRTSKTADAA